MNRLLLVAAVVAALAGLFLFGLRRGRPDRDIASNYLGRAVPTFEIPLYPRYQQAYGADFDLQEHLGRPMVINFWASWCGPCYQEAPALEAAWQRHRNDVLFLGIQTQDKDRRAEGEAFLDRFDLSFPNGIDDSSRVSIEYGLFGVPETFFVRADGTLAYKHTGPVSASILETRLAELTAGLATTP